MYYFKTAQFDYIHLQWKRFFTCKYTISKDKHLIQFMKLSNVLETIKIFINYFLILLHIPLLFLLFLAACLGVRFTSLGVPGSVSKGDSIWLECGYDLEGDELYSVKWYKDNVEFYRFMPSYKPSAQMYSLSGVFLDVS